MGCSPVIAHRKGRHEKLIEDIGKKGYVRLRIDGEIVAMQMMYLLR